MKLRIATCKTLPEIDADAGPLAAALARAGIDAVIVDSVARVRKGLTEAEAGGKRVGE